MNIILQNFLLQLGSLVLGVSGGFCLSQFAQEELSLYKKHIPIVFQFLSFTTLLAPLLFSLYIADFKKVVPFFVLFFVYVLLFWKTRDKKDDLSSGFLYIAPLTLFLASGNKEVLFLTLLLLLVTVILFVLSLFPSFEKMNLLKKCTFLAQEFSGFFFMTSLLYGFTFLLTFL